MAGGRSTCFLQSSVILSAIFRLDRPERECAHQRSGARRSLWVSEYLPGNVKPSGSIRFCDQPAQQLILFSSLACPGDETMAVFNVPQNVRDGTFIAVNKPISS